MNILYVCTGNTCRSPMAAAITLARMAEASDRYADLAVASCGLYAAVGAPASEGAEKTLSRHGLTAAAHQARQLTPDHIAAADLILTMTAAQAATLSQAFPQAAGRIRPLAGQDISDPFGGSDADYERAYREIDAAVAALLETLPKEDVG